MQKRIDTEGEEKSGTQRKRKTSRLNRQRIKEQIRERREKARECFSAQMLKK